ncbi:MAG TPA: hypothetical protein VF297_31195 [Pyrinomonadaceae bacterium]
MSRQRLMKMFLYCPETTSRDTLTVFRNRGYSCVELTDRAEFFWEQLGTIDDGGVLVLLSHGDAAGPLLVKGTWGNSMSAEQIKGLGATLVTKNLSLYLLSCKTGSGSFCEVLSNVRDVKFVAPVGAAQVRSGSGMCNAYSIEHNDDSEEEKKEEEIDKEPKYLPWAGVGILTGRERLTTPLQIP